MYIHSFEGSWFDHPFLRESFLVKTQAECDQIARSRVKNLWIDASKGLDIGTIAPTAAQNTPTPAQEIHPPAAEKPTELEFDGYDLRVLHKIQAQCSEGKALVENLFAEARMGKVIDVVKAEQYVELISQTIDEDPNLFLGVVRLRSKNEYTYMHSIAVGALMLTLAKKLKLDPTQVKQAGLAGLFHDLGKAFIPNTILDKPGPLTEAEFDIVKTHPQLGFASLSGSVIDPSVSDACLHHHEKSNGTGYPEGLLGSATSLLAKMVAICDVYDAITSDRPYKKGWDPAEALHKMALWSKDQFDQQLFQAFVSCIGIYPLGSLVRLKSGRLGVVVKQNEQILTKPIVKVFYSTKSKLRIPEILLNLSGVGQDDQIVCREDPHKWAFKNWSDMWLVAP